MVTLSGQSFASRMAGRLLLAIGATRGITETSDAYVETAVALATDPDRFAEYRSLFTETNWAATIGDIAGFTHHYEEALIQIQSARAAHTTAAHTPSGHAIGTDKMEPALHSNLVAA
jgi:predicted O-linked N-acetylglucosamine transferase (SPINDLY family)